MPKTKFTIGADPELFLRDAAGAMVASCGIIGGSKDCPEPLDDLGEGFAVLEDNVALEYNIPPCDSKAKFVNTINRAMSYLSDRISKQNLVFSPESAVSFPEDQLKHPLAMVFGCDPDFNAWNHGKRNPPPHANDKNLRSCGGHIHIGYPFKTRDEVIEFVKYADFFTIASVLFDDGTLRRDLYGKPGSYRYKPYGVEYRSLSNFWVLNSKYTEWAYNAMERAIEAWENKAINIDDMRDTIMQVYNNNDKILARQLVDNYNLPNV